MRLRHDPGARCSIERTRLPTRVSSADPRPALSPQSRGSVECTVVAPLPGDIGSLSKGLHVDRIVSLVPGLLVVVLGCGGGGDSLGSDGDATRHGAGAGSSTDTSTTGAGAMGTGAGGAGGADLPADPELDAFLGAQIAAGHVPGLSAAVLRHGALVWAGAYGLADVEQGVPVETDTLFLLASISKTVVSVALMQLEEQGLLSLDDDVGTLVPFDVRHPDYPGEPITVRMLATHTSSIRDDWNTLDANYVDGDSPIALGDFLSGYLTPGGAYYSPTTNFAPGAPGTGWEYSNIAVTLAGYVVEAVSGEPFDAYCESHVFAPLKMNETAWRIGDLDPTHVAMPYAYDGAGYSSYGMYGYPDYPDGLLRTSAPQLARFLSAFAHDGSLDGAKVLEPATAQAMRQAQVPGIDPTQGIIWYWQGDTIGHTGGDLGVSTSMFYRPADGAGVIFLMNAEPEAAAYGAIEQRLWQKADAAQ